MEFERTIMADFIQWNWWYDVVQISLAGWRLGRLRSTAVDRRLWRWTAEQNSSLCHRFRSAHSTDWCVRLLNNSYFSGPRRSVGTVCLCVCPGEIIAEINTGCRFFLAFVRLNSKIKVIGQSSQSQNENFMFLCRRIYSESSDGSTKRAHNHYMI